MEVMILGSSPNILKSFNSVDEFNLYYSKHKDEMDPLTTQKLNKMFKINGYRITKKDTRDKEGHLQQGIICLKKEVEPKEESKIIILENRINSLESKIKIITDKINDLIDKIST